jgi:quercetin dioxygenase-like cupin family protein
MKVIHSHEVPADVVEQGAEGTTIRWLIAKDDGAPNFAMRLFEVAPDGCTPRHQHDWEHEVFILSGEGVVRTADGDVALKGGSAVLVAPSDDHQFRNTGAEPLRMLCMIPHVDQ